MHFWIILYFLDPWQTGLDFAEKEKQHFVPWLEKFWNKKSQEIEKKSRQNRERSQRTPDFIALLQNLRGLKLVNSSVCWRYLVVETELGLLEASEVHGSICIALAALPRLLHHHHHHPTSSNHPRSSSVQVGFALEFALPFLQLALASMSLRL